jgi:hypothetical protein
MNDGLSKAQDEIERLKREIERLQRQIAMGCGENESDKRELTFTANHDKIQQTPLTQFTTGDVANLPLSLIENHDFVTDLARYAEGLYSEQQVKKKHHFDDETWARLGEDEVLIEAIEAEKVRRIRNGSTARERAQQHFASAPTVLGGILNDDGASPRHRIESARELRQIADNGPQATPAADRFIIHIDLGADQKLTIDKPRKPGLDDDKVIEGTTSQAPITDKTEDDWKKW